MAAGSRKQGRKQTAGCNLLLSSLLWVALPPSFSLQLSGGGGSLTEEKNTISLFKPKQTHSGLKIQHESVECGEDVWWEGVPAGGAVGAGDQAGVRTAPSTSPSSRGQRELPDSSKCPDSPITSPCNRQAPSPLEGPPVWLCRGCGWHGPQAGRLNARCKGRRAGGGRC